jgi:hypothetical protein
VALVRLGSGRCLWRWLASNYNARNLQLSSGVVVGVVGGWIVLVGGGRANRINKATGRL